MRTDVASGSWLTLLIDDEPPTAYDDLHRLLVAGARDGIERSAVEADATAALRVRALLQDHRRRLAELAALYDLAVRLTALRDLDALLQEVVTQARRLLDVDVAYLALAEPDRALLIHVTDGALGPDLRGVRLAPHSGLAGRVLDTGEPVSSHDYLRDEGLTHTQVADRVATTEGLRTITGVPLRLRGEVIGVLMTAQRDVRPPTPNDLSLLTSLASLAAVAIENARLFAQHAEAMSALANANDELRRNAESISRAATLHEQLMDVALRGGGVGQVLTSLADVIDGNVVFVDAADAAVAAQFHEPSSRRTVVDGDTVTVPVTSGDSFHGALQVRGASHDEVTLRLLERSAMTLALLEAVDRQVADAERRSADQFLEQLAGRRLSDDDSARRQALALGLDLGQPHAVLAFESDDERARQWAAGLVTRHGGLVAGVSGRLAAMVGAGLDLEALGRAPSPIGPVGMASPVTGVTDLATAYDDARACLTALIALGHHSRCATAADLGPFRYLLSTAGRDDAERFVDLTLGALIDHDSRRGTELVATARAYLANGQRHTDTARALGIHPNTLYQRLARIDKVLGPGWLHESRALDIQLALRMHGLQSVGH